MSDETRAVELELVHRMRAGDLLAFEDAYRQHGTRLYNLAVRMLGDADAEDAVQEVFLQAFRKLASFKGESAFGTWLYRLAMNGYVDRLRSRTARNDRQTDSFDAEEPVARAWAHDHGAELAVNRLDLERAVARLPEGCRAAFLLHDVEGFDHREVGAILGIAEGTSKSQVHKARLRLRALLAGAAPTGSTTGHDARGIPGRQRP